MKTQIRKAVFETNSSSSHSLTLSKGDVQMLTFPPDVLKAGKVEIGCDEFGWEWARLYKPISKLTYLVTAATHGDIDSYGSPEETTENLREDNSKIDQLCRVVEEHSGCRLLLMPGSKGYIDHESVGVDHEAYGSDELLRSFIFGPDAFVETGNDNSGPPAFIETDLGKKDDYYESLKVARPPAQGHTKAKLKLAKWSLTNAKGAKLTAGPLLTNIEERGVVVHAVMTVSPDYEFHGTDETGVILAELRDLGIRPSHDMTVKLKRDPKKKERYSVDLEFDVMLPDNVAKELGELV